MGAQSILVEAGGGGGGGGGARTWAEPAGAENDNDVRGAAGSVWREVAKNTALLSAKSYKTETSDVLPAELASTCTALSQSYTAPNMFCLLRFS